MSEAQPIHLSVVHAPKLSSGDDDAVAKQLGKLFADAQNGMRRIVALGLFAWEIKETKLKHGQWGPWLAAHHPKLATTNANGKPTASRALTGYMELTKGVLESVGFKTIGAYLEHISNSQTMRICHGGKFLLLPEKKVPADVRPLREKICALVDGKTQRQLFLEFKQAEDDKPKRGRLKGQGGATVKQRLDAKERARLDRLDACEADSRSFITYAEENSDDAHLGELATDRPQIFGQVVEAHQLLGNYLKRVNQNGK